MSSLALLQRHKSALLTSFYRKHFAGCPKSVKFVRFFEATGARFTENSPLFAF
jgi:hypothetical protein